MPFFLVLSLRRLAFTTVLLAVPWAPGLLAFPMVAVSSTPAFGQEVEGRAPASQAAPEPQGQPVEAQGQPPERQGRPPEPRPVSAGPEYALATLPPPAGEELWVAVSTGEQRVWVFRERNLVRDMVASTGIREKPTPLGTFRVQNRGEWFWSPKYEQGGFYWVSFLNWGEYLFHSIPTDRNRNILAEEAVKLGTPASHGCVRLAMEDARWLYDNLPAGARVEIY